MNLQQYKIKREQFQSELKQYRDMCTACLQPSFGCYCPHILKFDPKIKFIILMHPIEMKRRIATGRMSHLCLENSELFVGQDFSNHEAINKILQDTSYQPVVLYPGINSVNLSHASIEVQNSLYDANKKRLIFVIDGTWATARKMMRQSENLKSIQRVCFTPPGLSQFKVRKQPKAECYSTIEAIHHSIELMGQSVQFNLQTRTHDNLLYVFNKMVERQLQFIKEAFDNPRSTSYRRPKYRVA